jgi:hypothetical protein
MPTQTGRDSATRRDQNFTRYADQIAKIAKWSRIFEKQ